MDILLKIILKREFFPIKSRYYSYLNLFLWIKWKRKNLLRPNFHYQMVWYKKENCLLSHFPKLHIILMKIQDNKCYMVRFQMLKPLHVFLNLLKNY